MLVLEAPESLDRAAGVHETTLMKHLDLFRCPNCRSALISFVDIYNSGFYCETCERVFPVKDDISIILADEIRNYSLEYPILSSMLDRVTDTKIRGYLQITVALVEGKRNSSSWEWDDEEFWGNQYKKQFSQQGEEKHNDRYWQRQPIIDSLLKSGSLEGKTILSIGCGNGHNFRSLILPHCDENSLYIAADISFNGLALNKKLNPHRNSLYVLCSADYELPFEDRSLDVICYFGVLHHTRLKSMNIKKDRRVIKPGGHILLHEAIDRPETFIARYFDKEKSAHEEYVDREDLLNQFREDTGLKIVYKLEDSTPIHTLFMFYFKDAISTHKIFFNIITFFDALIAKTLGLLLPIFRAGSIGLAARLNNEKTLYPTNNLALMIPRVDYEDTTSR